MSLAQQRERVKDNVEVNGAPADTARAEAPVSAAVAEFRRGFHTESSYGLLMAFGEEPQEFQRRMESLLEELNPQRGMESELAEQIGQTFWRMRRFQRMQDGLALKRIHSKVEAEEASTSRRASQALALAQPFRNLEQLLARRGVALPADEIEEFAKSRSGDDSPEMREFIARLRELTKPTEKRARRVAMRQARADLRRLMEPYETLVWQCMSQADKVRGGENLAALMAPADAHSASVQNLEDLYLRRLWRLTNILAKLRQGAFRNKISTTEAAMCMKTNSTATMCP